MSDDFWDGFAQLLTDLFGAIGVLWVSLSVLAALLAGYSLWWLIR
jgi:hypothetical protein